MRALTFASRNTKEITRDILTLLFGVAFPIVLLVLLSAINKGIPSGYGPALFNIEQLAPGITVFGLSFLSLFASMLIAKDRSTSFVLRLFTSPLKPADFIIGYTLPLLPMAIIQTLVCYAAALFFQHPDCGGIHLAGTSFRKRSQREGCRRRMRRSADQPLRVVLKHLV